MYSLAADYVIELPSTPRPVRPLVLRRWCGFEVRALRLISYHAAREMSWAGGIRLPAYGYLFVERRPGGTPADVCNTVVGAAFFGQRVHPEVSARWFMTGVWLHPAARARGHFTRALAQMEAAFGHFAVCEPYSEGFRALMRRRPAVEAHAMDKLKAAG